MPEDRPPIPSEIKRLVRQQAGFGCVVCGNPLYELHHIVPYPNVKEHRAENIVPLCPDYHRRAHGGQFTRDELQRFKNSPHNLDRVEDRFRIPSSELRVKLAGTECVNVTHILVVDNLSLLSIAREGDQILLSTLFLDQQDQPLLEIVENEWVLHSGHPNVWDVEYLVGQGRQQLRVRSAPHKVACIISIGAETIEVRGVYNRRGKRVLVTPTQIIDHNHNKIIGGHIEGSPIGVAFDQSSLQISTRWQLTDLGAPLGMPRERLRGIFLHDQPIDLDMFELEDCYLKRCQLVFSGRTPAYVVGGFFDDTYWKLRGPAQVTFDLFRSFYAGGTPWADQFDAIVKEWRQLRPTQNT